MAAEKYIPEELRQEISAALQRTVPETLTPRQLSMLTKELGEKGFQDLQVALFNTVVGAVPSEEFSRQAEATERVAQLKSGLTSDKDERGRRHPSRSKHFMLISVGVIAALALLTWSSLRNPTPRRRPLPPRQEAPVDSSRASSNGPSPKVEFGDGAKPSDSNAATTPAGKTGAAAESQQPLEPTVPAPKFGAKGAYVDSPATDFYGYGDGPGAGMPQEQGPGVAATLNPLTGGRGASLKLGGGSGMESAPLSAGMGSTASLSGGSANTTSLAGGQGGKSTKLGGGTTEKQGELPGGLAMKNEHVEGRHRNIAVADAGYGSAAPEGARPTPGRTLRVPSLPAANTATRPVAKAASPALAPGTLLEGKIEAAPVLAAGLAEAPVSVRDEGGRIWLGVARLAGASGRAMITLDEVVIANRRYRTKASVLSTNRVYGVKVQAKEVSPAIASSTLRAAIGGVAEYVKGLQSSTKVYTDSSGHQIQESRPPEVQWVVAKRLAQIFDLPIEEKAITRIFVIDSGQPVQILVRQKPYPADEVR